jgi:hypothetical protein
VTSVYVYLAIAVILSMIGFAILQRGLRTVSRRSREQCIRCGHHLRVPTLVAPESADAERSSTQTLSEVCTECGRHPELDRDAPRNATILIVTGIAMQFVWLVVGAAHWPAAAMLLIETSVALLVFVCEPLVARWQSARVSRLESFIGTPPRPIPRRRFLRIAALLVVLGGWLWIFARWSHGQVLQELIAMRVNGAPNCWAHVSNQSEWMARLLPPGLVGPARMSGIIADVRPTNDTPLPRPLRDAVEYAWVTAPLSTAYDKIDVRRLREMTVNGLTDERFLGSESDRLPELPALRVLNLDGSSLSVPAIESFLRRTPNLRILRVNYLSRADAQSLQDRYPGIEVDAAAIYPNEWRTLQRLPNR